MGLMNRVLDTHRGQADRTLGSSDGLRDRETASTPRPAARSGSVRLSELLGAIEKSAGGVSAPVDLFERLRELLRIECGALLIRDHSDNRYKPWAHIGLDPTTTARLTMTHKQVAELCPDLSSSYRPDTSEPLRPFLSYRQSTQLQYAFVIRLRYQSRLAGVLILLDSNIVELESETREVLLGALSEPIGRQIVEGRERLFESMYSPLRLETADFRRSVRRLSGEIAPEDQGLVLFHIETAPSRDALLSRLPSYDRRRLSSDLRLVLTSLLGGAGDICAPADESALYLIAPLPASDDGETITFELDDRVRSLFPSLPATHTPIATRYCFPRDYDSLTEMLDLVPSRS